MASTGLDVNVCLQTRRIATPAHALHFAHHNTRVEVLVPTWHMHGPDGAVDEANDEC